jgi:hypothetical protein
LRAVVFAPSIGQQVCSRHLDPEQGPYPTLLAETLAVDGVRADVRNASMGLGMVYDAVQAWERNAFTHWPHLVVLQYGIGEAYPAFIPRWLHMKAWGVARTDGPFDRRINGFMQKRWGWFQKLSTRLDRPWMPGKLSVRRFRDQFRRLVLYSLNWTGAVVVVIGPHPPNFRLMKLTGAYPAKRAKFEQIMKEIVEKHPRCGYIDFQRVQDAIDPDDFQKTLPDGLHLVPEAHRILAQYIADEYREIKARLAATESVS